MAVELATAYISIIPSIRNAKSAAEAGLRPVAGVAASAGQESGGLFSREFEKATSKVGESLGRSLKVGGAVVGGAIAAAGTIGLKTAANLEQADIAFTTMLGSGEKAKSFLSDLNKFAAKTPFEFPELQTAASSLISVGINADKVIPIMTSLGNATSGMGTGSEGVKRATVALQQMTAAGKITAQDLNQLRDSGVPVFELLTAATGKTTAEIADMAANGKLGKTELDQLFSALESGKGLERFSGLMDKQSASLKGLWSTAKDEFTVGMAEAITPVIPLIKEGLGGATKFLSETVLPKVATGLTTAVDGVKAFSDGWKTNDGVINSSGFPGFLERVAEFLHRVIDSLPRLDFSGFQAFLGSLSNTGNTGRLLANIAESVVKLWPAVKEFATGLPSLFSGALTVLNSVLGFLADHVKDLIAFMPLIIGAFVAWRAAVIAHTAVVWLQNAAVVAHAIATNTYTGASQAAATAQWLWNAALNANPIAIVIIAIAALVAGLIWFFTQTELGRDIIKNVWGAIQGFIGGVVDWFQKDALPNITKVFTAVGAVFTWLWERAVQPVFGFISAVIGAWWEVTSFIFRAVVAVIQKVLAPAVLWLWEQVFRPVFGFIGDLIGAWWNTIVMPAFLAVRNFINDVLGPVFTWLWETVIKPAFDGIGSVIKTVWETIIKPIFDTLTNTVQKDIPNAFTTGKSLIETIWKGIQDVVKAPIRFVIETVLNDGLVGSFNTIAGFLGIPGLPKVALPAGFAGGGFTGPGGRNDPAGIVHAGEFVLTQRQTERAGVRNLYALASELDGYATGGLVHPVPNSWVSQWFWSGHNGIDFAADFGTPVYAAGPGRVSQAAFSPFGGGNEIHIDHPNGLQTWYAHLASFAVALGQMVSAGQQVGAVDSTGNSTGNHLHFMVLNGGWPNVLDPAPFLSAAGGQLPEKPAGGGGGPFNPVAAVIDLLVGKFTEAFPQGGKFIELVGGVGKAILQGAADFIAGVFGGNKDANAGGQKAAAPHGQAFGPLLFDGGGWLENTAGARLVRHTGSRPDAVLSHAQWETMVRIADGVQHGTEINFNGPVYGNPEHLVDEIESSKRRAAIHANLTAITMGG